MKRVRSKANLASIVEPQLVTLTKSPANRIGFKVIRSLEEAAAEAEVRRSGKYLISITLPEGATEEEATALAADFGLSDQYEVRENNGIYSLVRVDGEDGDDYVPVPMPNGLMAHVSAVAFQRSEEYVNSLEPDDADDCKEKKAIRLVSMRFASEEFPAPAMVDEWLKKYGIDYPVGGVELSENGYEVRRSESDNDTHEVSFGAGVTGVICRAEVLDFPLALYGKTVEQAYGSYGWSQLDFVAMMADAEFTDESREAIYRLQDLLFNIVLHSELPLDVRKQLIVNAVSGYAVYTIGLIDALPRVVQTRSDPQIVQENDMTTIAEKSEVAATETSAEVAAEQTAEQPITRAELATIVAEAVAAALVAKPVEVARTDATDEVVAAATGDVVAAAEPTDMEKLVGIVSTLAGAVEKMQGEQKAMRSELDEVEAGTTVSRSSVESTGVTEETAPVKRSNVFEGMFDGLLGQRG